jgi:hypothetical protein
MVRAISCLCSCWEQLMDEHISQMPSILGEIQRVKAVCSNGSQSGYFPPFQVPRLAP